MIISNSINVAIGELKAFEASKDFVHILRARKAMEEVIYPRVLYPDASMASERTLARKQQIKMWLKLVAALEKNLDPSFNATDFPARRTRPPCTTKEADPKAYAEHELAIKKNKEKTKNYNLQTGLRQQELILSRDLEAFIKSSYNNLPNDQNELDGILLESGISDARKQKLKALFNKG